MFIKFLSVQYNAFVNSTLHSTNGTDWIHVQGFKKYNRYLNAYLYIYILIHICIYIICVICTLIYIYASIFLHYVGRVWVTGIVIRYGLDGPGVEFRWWRNFQHPSRPTLGTSQPTVRVSNPFPGGKAAGAWSWPPTEFSAEVACFHVYFLSYLVLPYKYDGSEHVYLNTLKYKMSRVLI